jgi:hypothetical protein
MGFEAVVASPPLEPPQAVSNVSHGSPNRGPMDTLMATTVDADLCHETPDLFIRNTVPPAFAKILPRSEMHR